MRNRFIASIVKRIASPREVVPQRVEVTLLSRLDGVTTAIAFWEQFRRIYRRRLQRLVNVAHVVEQPRHEHGFGFGRGLLVGELAAGETDCLHDV